MHRQRRPTDDDEPTLARRRPPQRRRRGSNDEAGDTVVIGFSAPAADHGWMGSITESAQAEAEKYDDVELQVAEGTNDVNLQISQVETFINDGVDAIVLLPFDGAALTPVALKAMEAGIPVINVDREFDDPIAARATILGDNYGMGVSAGAYICSQLGDKPDAVVAEIAGIDSLPLTQDRSQGFEDALARVRLRGRQPGRRGVHRRVRRGGRGATCCRPRRRSTPSGTTTTTRASASWRPSTTPAATSSSWSAAPARPTRCADIQAGDTVLKATVIYPSTQAADGIKLARLLVQGKAHVRPGRGRGAAR